MQIKSTRDHNQGMVDVTITAIKFALAKVLVATLYAMLFEYKYLGTRTRSTTSSAR